MKLIRGNQLSAAVRAQVLSAFVYRHLDTTTTSDNEWLATKAFYVTAKDSLSLRHRHCEPHYLAE